LNVGSGTLARPKNELLERKRKKLKKIKEFIFWYCGLTRSKKWTP